MPSTPEREEALFAAALDRSPSEREAFLRAEVGDDPALLQRLRALLAAHAGAGKFLEERTQVALTEALRALSPCGALPDLIGQQLGPYRIISRLGEGGVGIVYLAEQLAPLHREVALKVIKPGMDTREVITRFEGERQALARMDHPGIARVYDAGATAEGHPYFVMERVHGLPITRYCDEHRLRPEARLKLFAEVCAAVQHAHQKGVIHRDLKPSNILVTTEGAPKIIDFGIAKAAAGALTDATLVTALSHIVGTPAYMSPEQAAGPLDIDTRSDVYSLGVLLHELLTGRPPLDASTLLQAGLDALRRHIREIDAARPSTLLGTLDSATLSTAAAHRQLPPDRLVALLRGELDWIVLRCLEKDRARRYATAHDLAEDIRRYLADEPVAAAAPGTWYALRKFARRHRAAVIAGTSIALTLTAATAVSTWQAIRATRAERLAEERRQTEATARAAAEKAEANAKTEAAIAAAVVKFLRTDLLGQVAPDAQPNRDLPLRQALDNAAKAIDTAFPGQPALEAAVRETLGITYGSLGAYATARTQYEKAWQLRRETLGANDPRTLTTLNNLIAQLGNLEDFAAAEKLGTEALALHVQVFGKEHLNTIEVMTNLGSNRVQEGRAREAEPLLTEALSLARKVLGPEHSVTLILLSNLAACHTQLERYAEASASLEELIAIRRRLLGPEHPRTLNAQQTQSGLLGRLGRHQEAFEACTVVYEGRRKVLGPEHPQTLIAWKNLGDACDAVGRYAEAEHHYAGALAAQTRLLGPAHRRVLDLARCLDDVRAKQIATPSTAP